MFLDEVNTASVLGLFKEVIVDQILDAKGRLCNLLLAVITVPLNMGRNKCRMPKTSNRTMVN